MASRRSETAVQRVEPDMSALISRFQGDESTLEMAAHRIVPRLKIMQGMSEAGMKGAAGGDGAVVLAPGGLPLAGPKDVITVNPLFFFAEYIVWNDRADKVSPRVHDRSYALATDPGGEIARRALNVKMRAERYGGSDEKPWMRRWVEHLNFICYLVGSPHGTAVGDFVTLSFERGENMQGRSFINAITSRRIGGNAEERVPGVKVPLWAQVWDLRTALRTRGDNNWWGFDFTASDPSIIDQSDADHREGQHRALKEEFKARTLVVDRTDADDEVANDASTPM